MVRHSRWMILLVAMMSLALLPACGDDDGDSMMNGGGDPLLGSWSAVSFSVDGQDQVVTGMDVTITFAASTYTIDVTGDSNNIICEMTTDCSDGGGLGYTSGTVTFDPGMPEEVTLNYTINGTTLTLNGGVGGRTLSATLTRV